MNDDFVSFYVSYKMFQAVIPIGILISIIYAIYRFDIWAREQEIIWICLAVFSWVSMPAIFFTLRHARRGVGFLACMLMISIASSLIFTGLAYRYYGMEPETKKEVMTSKKQNVTGSKPTNVGTSKNQP